LSGGAVSAAPLVRPLVLGVALGAALGGCTATGRYTLVWSIEGEAQPDAYACASHGIDGIQVQAMAAGSGEPVDLTVFPCAPHEATRSLPAGGYDLYVSPVDARGARLADPQTGQAFPPQIVPVVIPEDGGAEVRVTIALGGWARTAASGTSGTTATRECPSSTTRRGAR
jgi:hypothetical protein